MGMIGTLQIDCRQNRRRPEGSCRGRQVGRSGWNVVKCSRSESVERHCSTLAYVDMAK